MGSSNYLYRDSLYALDTYVTADEADCICDQEALAVGCEHESDCPAIDGYHDEFLFDETKANLIRALDEYSQDNYTIYGYDDGPVNDNRNFPAHIIGRVYKEFEFTSEHALGSITFTVGDDFCLRSGYYSGFNFDRVESRYADNGCDALEFLADDLYERLHKYDELGLSVSVENGDVTDAEAEAIKDRLFTEAIREIEAFIAEVDTIYHNLGEKYFNTYRVVARANNGETFYEKTA